MRHASECVCDQSAPGVLRAAVFGALKKGLFEPVDVDANVVVADDVGTAV